MTGLAIVVRVIADLSKVATLHTTNPSTWFTDSNNHFSGSVLGGWAGLPGLRVTKAQYDEIGPNICHTRFTDSIPISM